MFSNWKYLFKVRKKVSKHIWANRKSWNDFWPTFDYLANRNILNNKIMGGWTQKEERGSKIPPLLFCSFHFLVSISARVCAPTLPLTNKVNLKSESKK
jgi:hypothetical protein